MATTFEGLLLREDYEFFLARILPDDEVLGWIALSFDFEGNEAENRDTYEAKLERTEMYSPILKGWKLGSAGEKSNAWDAMKRTSSSLQAKHLPPNYCIINTLVFVHQYEMTGVANHLIRHAVNFWRDRVAVGTEWAVWVQTPTAFRYIYIMNGFKEVDGYAVDLGDYGFFPKQERRVSGNYEWSFMVLQGASGSATVEPDGAEDFGQGKKHERRPKDVEEHVAARKVDKDKGKGIKGKEQRSENMEEHRTVRIFDKGKGKEQRRKDMEEHITALKVDKGKGKEHRMHGPRIDEYNDLSRGDRSEDEIEESNAWEEAEERLDDIEHRRGPPPLPGEVATLRRIQRRAELQGFDPASLLRGKSVPQQVEDVRLAPPQESLTYSLQGNPEVTGQPPDHFIPTKSEEDLIEAMRKGGVDEEEIELVCALALSLTDEAEHG